MTERFDTKCSSQLRLGAICVGVVAVFALILTAIVFGASGQLLIIAMLGVVGLVLINFLMRRSRGLSAGYGALTVSRGITTREVDEIDIVAVWGAGVYCVGMVSMLVLFFWRR